MTVEIRESFLLRAAILNPDVKLHKKKKKGKVQEI